MARHNKSYTAPKGRPTTARREHGRNPNRIPAIFEWILVALALVALLLVAWYFSVRGDGGTPSHGAPVAVMARTFMVMAITGTAT